MIVGIGALVALLTGLGVLDRASLALVVLAVALVALTRPDFALLLYAFSIPLEAIVLFSGPVSTTTKATGALLLVSFLRVHWRRLRPSILPIALILFTAWTLLSSLWLPQDVNLNSVANLTYMVGVAYVVAHMVVDRPGIGITAVWAFASGALVAALLGVHAYVSTATSGYTRAAAFLDQSAAHFGALMIPVLILGIALMLDKMMPVPIPRIRPAIVGSAFAVSAVVALIVSGTRSAWTGAIVGLVVLLVEVGRGGTRSLPRLAIAAGIIALSVATILFVIPTARDLVDNRLGTAIATGGAGRVDIWAVGLGIARDNPVTGVGYGGFEASFDQDAIARPLFESNLYGPVRGRFAAHNIYLAALAELGLVGVALWIAFLWTLLGRNGRSAMPVVVLATLVAYLAQGFFLDTLNRKYFWLFVGLAVGYAAIPRVRREESNGSDRLA